MFKAADIEILCKRERNDLAVGHQNKFTPQLASILYHNAESLSSVLAAVFKKKFREFFGLGGGHFFTLNFVWIISVGGVKKAAD